MEASREISRTPRRLPPCSDVSVLQKTRMSHFWDTHHMVVPFSSCTNCQDMPALVLLTSKNWRLQSGCNHSTAYVDQWKGYEPCELLTQSHHAALRTGNAHQDLKISAEIC